MLKRYCKLLLHPNLTIMKCIQPKLKLVFLTMLVALISMNEVLAQSDVKGTITDTKGQPLTGVSVLVKGSKRGTTTDAAGRFTINAPGNGTIIFTMVGYTEKEVKLSNQTLINLQLNTRAEDIGEVVVTALGVKKEVKRLGYAVQEVKGTDLVKAREPNPINSLVGKIAGLDVAISREMLAAPAV